MISRSEVTITRRVTHVSPQILEIILEYQVSLIARQVNPIHSASHAIASIALANGRTLNALLDSFFSRLLW